MGNHNIRITYPDGHKVNVFLENTTRQICMDWIEENKPAQIGEHHQIVNFKKPPKKYPAYYLVTGYDENDEVKAVTEAGKKLSSGEWYTKRIAKRDGRALGAKRFKVEKVWSNGKDPS